MEKSPSSTAVDGAAAQGAAPPGFLATPNETDPFSGTITMKDGRRAWLRSVDPSDFTAMREFNHRLSIESLQFRFFTTQEPDDCVVRQLCEGGDRSDHLTFIVEIEREDCVLMVGHGVYVKCCSEVAEFSVAVLDDFQGLGIGSVLLDRLATVGIAHGFKTFRAITSAINHRMLSVFRHSGFPIDTVVSEGLAEIDLRITSS